ncbi:hypothetical protein EYF80_051149 [Liparis tanakae]|uniref:Uncharacterized protein n=1 Tax=Liparis tanakae TaxID=230148 RepID=A0A4Z2FBW3_9TELE|nr:hypothetical protein EYF80_051149 [Liparis tanakae]
MRFAVCVAHHFILSPAHSGTRTRDNPWRLPSSAVLLRSGKSTTGFPAESRRSRGLLYAASASHPSRDSCSKWTDRSLLTSYRLKATVSGD